MTAIEEILVVGAGAIGSEVALQSAMSGYRVTVLDTCRDKLRSTKSTMEIQAAALGQRRESVRPIMERIYFTLALDEAGATADLVSECIPENLEMKRRLFARLGAVSPPHTIFTTNSSSLLPSTLAPATGRPDRFLALHFHRPIWKTSLVDVMPHAGTDASVVEVAAGFARSLRQVPIMMARETPGYVFNAMLQAYLEAAFSLWAGESASFEDIDRSWMLAEGATRGPFGVMDFIGLDTIRDIAISRTDRDGRLAAMAEHLSIRFVDRGLLGVKSGEGFYRYPNPAYAQPGFVPR